MDELGKYHPELYNSITKEHTLYILTDKWILGKDHGIAMIQHMEHMKFNQKIQDWMLQF